MEDYSNLSLEELRAKVDSLQSESLKLQREKEAAKKAHAEHALARKQAELALHVREAEERARKGLDATRLKAGVAAAQVSSLGVMAKAK